LCSHPLCRECLSQVLTCDILASLIESLLTQGYISYAAATSPFCGADRDEKEEGTLSILLTLNLASKLQKYVADLPQFLAKTLKEARVQDFLGLGLTSGRQEQVEISIRLLALSLGAEDARPEVPLCSFIASLNRQRKDEKTPDELKSSGHNRLTTERDNVIQNKENQPANFSSLLKSYTSGREDNSAHTLISQTQNILQSSSSKSMEVTDMYDIKSLKVKEEHLNNLLEARSLALTQADRVIGQLRNRQVSHVTDMKNLQGALKQSEQKVEQMISKMNDMRMEAERLQRQFEKQSEEKSEEMERLAKEITETREKCSNMEEMLCQCQQEKKTLSKMKDDLQRAHENLKEQYNLSCSQSNQLEEERKTLSKQLKEKDAAVLKLSSNLQTLQSTYGTTKKERNELEREKEEIEECVESLRSQLSSSENLNRQLQQKSKTLEAVNEEVGRELVEKTSRIAELEKELEKHNQIVSFINNMNLKKK